ncbi:MAG: 3-phosphoshikimate 1-carboxyvinyltransferase [Bacteroidia bacterium]
MIYRLTYNGQTYNERMVLSGSKSESNRVLIIRFLSQSNFQIENLSNSDDTKVLEEALKNIDSKNEFDVEHAGTAMRFLTALFCITKGERILKGSPRMHERPIKLLVDALKALGAEISYLEKEGFPPLKIKGKNLSGSEISIRGNISSQYLSALAMIAPYLKNGLTLIITSEFTSKPYLLMTLNMMRHFGINVEESGNKIIIKNGNYSAKNYSVESDWSSASYWFEAMSFCSGSSLELIGLKNENSLQPDSIVKELYTLFGVNAKPIKNGIKLTSQPLKTDDNWAIDFTNFPDIAQTLACTFVGFQKRALLNGLHTLRIKETDRIEAMKHELEKLGAIITTTDNSLEIIDFKPTDKNHCINTYNDHRMAMSFASLVFILKEINIKNPQVVSKSYPQFWDNLKQLGVKIERIIEC